jgi:hypothetical protein
MISLIGSISIICFAVSRVKSESPEENNITQNNGRETLKTANDLRENMSEWTDSIVGDRMTVDREFNDRVTASEFSNQEWGLIMTATELDIENADNPETARLIADTENLSQIMPELDTVQSQMSQMGGSPRDTGGGSGGGVVESIKGVLGLGSNDNGSDEERLEAAERLAQAYADELQSHLEAAGKWKQVRVAYQE